MTISQGQTSAHNAYDLPKALPSQPNAHFTKYHTYF